MGWFIGIYIIGFVVNICASGGIYEDGNQKLGARLGLLTPVWPLSLAFGLYLLVQFLLKKADLEQRKDRA